MLTDLDLILMVGSGNGPALEALYDRYARLVFSLALKILHDRTAAEDAVQQVFMKVWRGAAEYAAERGKVSSWIAQIAHNEAIDELRRRRCRPFESENEEMYLVADSGPTPLDHAIDSLEHHRIREALSRLPREQRRVIELAYFEGFTHEEIAGRLGMPLGTVKTRIRRGLQHLRAFLEPSPRLQPAREPVVSPFARL